MELPIALQALQFLQGAGLGLAAGLCYDLFRALRRLRRSLTPVLDLLFCLLLFLALLLMILYGGRGELHLFMLLAVGLGMLFWFLTFSRPILYLLDRLLHLLARGLRCLSAPIFKLCKNGKNILKKLFLFVEKQSIIKDTYPFLRFAHHHKEGRHHDSSKIITDTEADSSGGRCVCYRYPGEPAVSNSGQKSAGRRSHGVHQRHRT